MSLPQMERLINLITWFYFANRKLFVELLCYKVARYCGANCTCNYTK